jgi:hydroxymethylglutaryl-CoA lyase
LADTVGLASEAQISEAVGRALTSSRGAEIGVHLHARSGDAAEKIRAAYKAGCRRFDAAMGGLGGCPFAQDALVGNVPTESLIGELKAQGAHMPVFEPLDELIAASLRVQTEFGAPAD